MPLTKVEMKVAHFCTFPHGGAATAAIRQHKGLRQAGVDSRFYYFRDEKDQTLDNDFSKVEFFPPRNIGPLAAVNSFLQNDVDDEFTGSTMSILNAAISN